MISDIKLCHLRQKTDREALHPYCCLVRHGWRPDCWHCQMATARHALPSSYVTADAQTVQHCLRSALVEALRRH